MFPRRVQTNAGDKPSIAVVMKAATLTDVRIATVAHVPIFGDVTVFVRVRGRNTPVGELVLDASYVGASIGMDSIRLGADVSSVGEIKVATAGIATGSATMVRARLTGVSLIASSLSMKGAHFSVVAGATTC